MGAAVLILFFVPWLDRSPVKSIRYKGPIYKIALAIFVRLLHRARGVRPEAALGHLSEPREGLHRAVFRVLCAHALVHEDRQREAGAGQGDGA